MWWKARSTKSSSVAAGLERPVSESEDTPLLPLRVVVSRTGLTPEIIRAWERRYGVVSPKRTASGYRLYDDQAIATLVRVRELTETGWTASEASRAVLAGEATVVATAAAADDFGMIDDAGAHPVGGDVAGLAVFRGQGVIQRAK